MPLTETERSWVLEFLEKVKTSFSDDGRFSEAHDRDPGLPDQEPPEPEVWLTIWENTWIRVNPHPEQAGVQVSLATRARNVSEAIEGNALQLGDSFEELLEDGLEDAGEENVYGVYHYHDSGVFYFQSELPLQGGWADLKADAVREKVCKLALGYPLGFGRFFMEED